MQPHFFRDVPVPDLLSSTRQSSWRESLGDLFGPPLDLPSIPARMITPPQVPVLPVPVHDELESTSSILVNVICSQSGLWTDSDEKETVVVQETKMDESVLP